ncbi:hypothetical protein V3C99_010307 [Haemonchus contortus]
MKAENDY